uniref:Uncharacterized protein n=1 Tax=Roseihalotalea indica TaxID=2867963 RepID=A0AA49GGS0_9BACT|nr:hypothetical protein K4G66_17965 [Tunicatimonas sp. TK19036]
MSFSDWITIVSILLAVLLAVFKFDEWEIIRLKKYERYIRLPILFLLLSGFAAYFQVNTHPTWLDFLWIDNGLESKLWAIIWMVLFILCSYICWKKFTNSKPSYELIHKYNDYLNTYEPAKFSSLFRKYERYFFKPNAREDVWLPYVSLLTNKKWWLIAPYHFKEKVYKNPERFYKMNRNVLKSLLFAQFENIPDSQITNELETQWNGVSLSENTPVLNIFLKTSHFIEKGRDNNILLPSIKEVSEEYFSSIEFVERDKAPFLLPPSAHASRKVAPHKLAPFYFIQFIDCYWHQVINTNAKVSGFFFYLDWTEKILDAAPEIRNNDQIEPLPNLYIHAVDRMLENIGEWGRHLKDHGASESAWAAEHFAKLKQDILCTIQDKHLCKVHNRWFLREIENFFSELANYRNHFGEKFDFDLSNCALKPDSVEKAFKRLTDKDYYSETEQQDSGYQWLKNILLST